MKAARVNWSALKLGADSSCTNCRKRCPQVMRAYRGVIILLQDLLCTEAAEARQAAAEAGAAPMEGMAMATGFLPPPAPVGLASASGAASSAKDCAVEPGGEAASSNAAALNAEAAADAPAADAAPFVDKVAAAATALPMTLDGRLDKTAAAASAPAEVAVAPAAGLVAAPAAAPAGGGAAAVCGAATAGAPDAAQQQHPQPAAADGDKTLNSRARRLRSVEQAERLAAGSAAGGSDCLVGGLLGKLDPVSVADAPPEVRLLPLQNLRS